MGPVSKNVIVGIDDDQRFALMKFRRTVQDILKPDHDDHFLLRWLKARQWDPAAAEKMLRDSMAWREKWGIDTTLATWQGPGILSTYFPSGTTGFDKEGSPIIIVPFSGFDAWGLLHVTTRTEVIRMVLKHLEGYLESARKQAETHGPNALKLVVIFDMEGYNIRQYAWKPAAEMVFTLLKVYEANYPEILKKCYIVNAPKVFALAYSVVKKFMHENTIEKITVYGSDQNKWQPAVLEMIDKDQLPVFLGGTVVDANGDPRCGLLVKPGGKVPKSLFSKNTNDSSEKDYTRVTVKSGDKHSYELVCSDKESILKWEIGVENHDIKYSIKRKDVDGTETVVHGPKKVPEGPVDVGVLPITGPATYSVVFDNKSSYLTSKKIYYDVMMTIPERDLNLDDSLAVSTNL